MIAELLEVAPYAAPGALLITTMAAGWYAGGHDERVSMKKVNVPKPHEATEAEILKTGWELLEQINHDIHRMYHPEGCQCAFCVIKGDDTPYTAPVAERCAEPCYGCSVITCVKHPDHGPSAITPPKPDAPYVVYREDDAPPPIADHMPDTAKQVIIRQHTAIKNLESQLRTLGAEHAALVTENEQLKEAKGIRSAGIHIGGKPVFHLEPTLLGSNVHPLKWHERQIGTIGRKCYDCGAKGFKLITDPEGDGSVAVCKDCWPNYQRSVIAIGADVEDLE